MPNRIIKESIRTSKKVNALNDFQFRTWLYLITYVDDFGRGSADPELLKGFVFPRRKGVTEVQIQKALADLANTGMIKLYEVDGDSFFYFPNWAKHQRIQTKQSKFPEPPESTVNHGESPPESNPIRIQSESNTESKREVAHAHGEYGWVKLTDKQMDKLIADYGAEEVQRAIAYVDESAQTTGNKNKWKDWNLTVRKCIRDGWGKGANRNAGNNTGKTDTAIFKKSAQRICSSLLQIFDLFPICNRS